jgi:hypothetical protein
MNANGHSNMRKPPAISPRGGVVLKPHDTTWNYRYPRSHRRSKRKRQQSMVCADAVCPPSRFPPVHLESTRCFETGPILEFDPEAQVLCTTWQTKKRKGFRLRARITAVPFQAGGENKLFVSELAAWGACLFPQPPATPPANPSNAPKIGRDNGPDQLPRASMRRARSAHMGAPHHLIPSQLKDGV